MARQTLNRGTTANDGTGDTLRTAAQKINENFQELYQSIGGDSAAAIVSLSSVGVVFEGQVADSHETYMVAVEPTTDNYVYVPNDGGTLVLDSCAQTLTNKTILSPSLTTPSIKDNDSSHSYNVVVGNLSANRNITIPSLSTNDTFVFADATQTLSNKTINGLNVNNPVVGGIDGGSKFFDSSDNEYLQFNKTSNAVNFITLTNSATNTGPTIDVDGDDTNVSLNLSAKGTGGITFTNKIVFEKGTDVASTTAVNLNQPLTVFNSGSFINPTLGDGTIQAESKYFSNIGAGEVHLTPAGGASNIQGVDSAAGFIKFTTGQGCQLIWNTTASKWFIVGNNGTTTA